MEFPHNNEEDIIVVDIVSGDYEGMMKSQGIQLMVRSTHPSDGEELANTLIETLHNLTSKIHEDWQVVLITATRPSPFFNGTDENERYLYTVDFRVLSTKI